MPLSSSSSRATGLSVDGLCLSFGGVHALSDVTLSADSRSITGIIGANGSGKTSLLNVISRLYSATQGNVTFQGRDVLKVPSHRVRGLGISRSFQNVRLFDGQSVLENLMMGEIYRWRWERFVRSSRHPPRGGTNVRSERTPWRWPSF